MSRSDDGFSRPNQYAPLDRAYWLGFFTHIIAYFSKVVYLNIRISTISTLPEIFKDDIIQAVSATKG